MKIGIDIDDVVIELVSSFCKFYNSKHKGDLCIEDFKGYYLSTILPINREEEYPFFKEFHDSEDFDEISFIRNAKESIDKLKQDHELVFITARNLDWKQKTLNFFNKHFNGDDFKLVFSGDIYGGRRPKEEICKEMGINVLIEDHHEKTLNYANAGIDVILFDRPWNKNTSHDKITRVHNWNEILDKIKEIENDTSK